MGLLLLWDLAGFRILTRHKNAKKIVLLSCPNTIKIKTCKLTDTSSFYYWADPAVMFCNVKVREPPQLPGKQWITELSPSPPACAGLGPCNSLWAGTLNIDELSWALQYKNQPTRICFRFSFGWLMHSELSSPGSEGRALSSHIWEYLGFKWKQEDIRPLYTKFD